MAVRRRYFAGLSRDTFLLALSSLFADISTEMLYPVLPVFLTETLKTSGSILGLIEGAAQATQNLVQGLSGSLSDRLGRRKPIALAGYALAAIAKPLMGAAGAWPGVLGGRFLDRFGAGARSAPRDALVAASADQASRGRAFGLEGAGDNAGAFLGPLLAVLLLFILHIGIRWIFYLAIIPGLLAFLMVLLVKEPASAARTPAGIEIGPARFPRAYWRYLLAIFLAGAGNSSNAFLILRTQDIGASLQTTILIYAGYNLVAALISYPAGSLSDRFGRKWLLIAAFAVFLATYLGFATVKSPALMGLLFILYGLYQGVFRTAGKAMASDLVPETLRASGVGWYSAAVGLSGLVASLVAGVLWDRVGHAAVFLYGASFAAIGAAALLVLVPAAEPRAS